MGLLSRAGSSFLPNRDYLPLAMPAADLDVLSVLTKDGGALRRFGAMADMLSANQPLSNDFFQRGTTVAAATGTANSQYKQGLSFGVVNAILQALGAEASVDLRVSGARGVEFSYTDVTRDEVILTKLDGWLHRADLSSPSGRVAELLVAEKLFITVGVLRAGGLQVSFKGDSGAQIAVAVPPLQQVVGAKVSLSGSGGRTHEVVFTGTPLVIAAKAAQLRIEPYGFWVKEQPVKSGEIRDLDGGPTFLRTGELSLQP